MILLIRRYIKYTVTSGVGAVIEVLVLWLLSDFVFHKGYLLEYIVSPVIAFQCSVPVNYIISYYYVWKDREVPREHRPGHYRLHQFLWFSLWTTMVFVVRLGALLAIEAYLGWNVVLCSLLAMVISGLLNFVISNQWVFSRQSDK